MTHQVETKTAETDLELAQLDEVAGGLTKVGMGTLVLASANTYTGTTTVAQGSLAL